MNVNVSFSDELIKILDYLFEKFGVAIDWTNKDVMPYLKSLADKIVVWEESIAWLWIWAGIVAIIVGIIWIIVNIIRLSDGGWSFLAVCLIAIGIVIGMTNAYTVITCRTFPEKIVLEYISETWDELESKHTTNNNSRY